MVIIEDINENEVNDLIRRLAAKTKKRIDIAAKRFGQRLVKKLEERTPVYTGASKGTLVTKLNNTHPARYYDTTDLGWKLNVEGTKKDGFTIHISNAMWDHYLKYVEYGMQRHGPNKNIAFVRTTLVTYMTSQRFFADAWGD
jgi:hypothetical protein